MFERMKYSHIDEKVKALICDDERRTTNDDDEGSNKGTIGKKSILLHVEPWAIFFDSHDQ
jgi:hypothetical protein